VVKRLFYTIYKYIMYTMKNRWPRWSLADEHRESSRSVIAKREGHDHQGQRVFGRGVRPRVDNFDHRGQRVYEGSALAVHVYVYEIKYCSYLHCTNPTIFVCVVGGATNTNLRPALLTALHLNDKHRMNK